MSESSRALRRLRGDDPPFEAPKPPEAPKKYVWLTPVNEYGEPDTYKKKRYLIEEATVTLRNQHPVCREKGHDMEYAPPPDWFSFCKRCRESWGP